MKKIENRAMDKRPVRSLQDILQNIGLDMPVLTENSALFLEGMKYYGVRSVQGKHHNPIVRGFLRRVGYGRTDDLNWCAAFMATIASDVGLEYSNRPTARSWRKVGEKVELASAAIGHVVIFWRGSRRGWKGHVGIFAGRNRSHIYVLGGNQGRKVCIKSYRISRLLGIRDLKLGDSNA